MTLELRERVALAIEAANLEDGASYRTAADAAIAVCLPDREAFENHVDALMDADETFVNFYSTMPEGRTSAADQREYQRLSVLQDEAKAALMILVLGQPDAGAGGES